MPQSFGVIFRGECEKNVSPCSASVVFFPFSFSTKRDCSSTPWNESHKTINYTSARSTICCQLHLPYYLRPGENIHQTTPSLQAGQYCTRRNTVILLNLWKNKHGFGSLTHDLCVQDDKLSSTAVVLRACCLCDSIIALGKGERREGTSLVPSSKESEYPVTGTMEIAAQKDGGAGGNGVRRNNSKQS